MKSGDVTVAHDWRASWGKVCDKRVNNFAQGGLVIRVETSAGRSTKGRYTSSGKGVKLGADRDWEMGY